MTKKTQIEALIKKLHPIDPGIRLIRFGPQYDGGYLIPDDLEGILACFSPGVGSKIDFELACAEYGMDVFLADGSISSLPKNHHKFQFINKNIAATEKENCITLQDWVHGSLEEDIELLLQMDIEGYEYEVILSTPKHTLNMFRTIVIEFHFLDQLWNKPFFLLANATFEKLLDTHDCIHIHPNNYSFSVKTKGVKIPRLMEFTFHRRDRVKFSGYQSSFPHCLDSDNSSRRSLYLPRFWYECDK
jgi:hypothetical protein